MEWNRKYLFLNDEDINRIALYLAYGTVIGVIFGVIFGDVPLFFSLGAALGIVISTAQNLLEKLTRKNLKK